MNSASVEVAAPGLVHSSSNSNIQNSHVPPVVHSSLITPHFTVTPPFGFSFIEEKICRAFAPLLPNMFTFLDTANIGCIINVSGELLDDNTLVFLQESNISLVIEK